ncbi:MAG: hypothetical protein IT364_04065 [Candidatus Hydrogenedentes bacterium]|nr:hypothetical protein [Candidatus Hydrogenedentota bacterium]
MAPSLGVALAILGVSALVASAAEPAIKTFMVSGPYQPAPVAIEVLAPDPLEPGAAYPVLYVLPVESGTISRWGSGIQEVAKADIAKRYGVICVAPAFAATPWFANHPSDPVLRQEDHFIKVVLPWVEEHYPVKCTRDGRFLLGFSKSGYGAIMLLLRHPGLFERAVAWDAPVDKTQPDQFRMIDVFGTNEHFAHYAIPGLIPQRINELKDAALPRLILMPNGDTGHKMNAVHEQLLALGIPHMYEKTDSIQHHWNSGWVPRASKLVLTGKADPESR